jgi:hypothetical protein
MQQTLCSLARRVAYEHFGIRLDLSTRSVRHVDRILAAIHKEHLRSRSNEGFDGIALEFAAYIVDVIQRNFGPAHWERDCSRCGADAYPLHWRELTLYPYEWCRKRIYDGGADAVWSQFQAVVLGRPPRRWWQQVVNR